MKAFLLSMALAGLALAGCERGRHEEVGGVIQTKFPGQVTAGGGTSGQVLARSAKPVTEGTYSGGQPGIAGGAGGTTGGAATAGTVQETGHGPSHGTTQPSSLGRPGARQPSGDKATPAAPPPGTGAAPAVQRDNPPPAAPSH